MPCPQLDRPEQMERKTSVQKDLFPDERSPDPALGDYLPTAGADNSSLPGMGGLFNTTNSHLYHYAGNNPVRYVDPDGWAYTIKTFNNKYAFAPDLSVFDKALYTLTGLIAFGTQASDLGHSFSDMKRINIEYEDLSSIWMNTVIFLTGNSGSVFLEFISSVFSTGSNIIILSDVCAALGDQKRVAMEYFIADTFSNELYSTSHENVEKLYNFAMQSLAKFEELGYISIEPGLLGGLKNWEPTEIGDKALEALRTALKLYRKQLEEAQ